MQLWIGRIDRLLYDDVHIRVIVNVNSLDDTIKVDTNVNFDVDNNYFYTKKIIFYFILNDQVVEQTIEI